MLTDPSGLTVTELTTALRAGAAGHYASQAAVELLIRHWTWLSRPAFLRACVEPRDPTSNPALHVDWRAARSYAESIDGPASDRAVLLIAAQIGTLPELDIPDSYPALGWLIPALGRADLDLILATIAHASGTHDHVEHLGERGATGERAVTSGTVRLALGSLHPCIPGLRRRCPASRSTESFEHGAEPTSWRNASTAHAREVRHRARRSRLGRSR